MPEQGFTHLHLHSQYSLLDGAIKFGKLFDRCKELGMDAVAVTDHGNLFGAVEFYTKAVAAEIKPILGIEAYIAPGEPARQVQDLDLRGRVPPAAAGRERRRLQNLLKLVQLGYLEGFYYRPAHRQGTSRRASRGSDLHDRLPRGRSHRRGWRRAIWTPPGGPRRSTWRSSARSGSSSSCRDQGMAEQDRSTRGWSTWPGSWAWGWWAPTTCTSSTQDDHEAHEVLCCICTGKTLDERPAGLAAGAVPQEAEEMRRAVRRTGPEAWTTRSPSPRCATSSWTSRRATPRSSSRPDGPTPDEYLPRLV